MANDKIRLAIIGANAHRVWASRAHLPAAAASSDVELTAVCTTRQESADEAARKFGARLAFHDYREMLTHRDIDAVAVVLRVPSHYEPTMAAIEAGKHVYTEWPLGQNTAQAIAMAEAARTKGVRNMVGLQARADPAIMYLKELIAGGYVGDVLSCHVSLVREGVLERISARTWQRDVTLGANTLTIAAGHTIDAMRFVLGEVRSVAATIGTQTKQWFETDTKKMVDVTSPDTITVSGRLANGALATVHVASVPYAGSGYRMEIYGSEGTLVALSADSPQLKNVRLEGASKGNKLEPIEIPPRFIHVPKEMPRGEPSNVGQAYHVFAGAIRAGNDCAPDFYAAVELHRLSDAIRAASDSGITQTIRLQSI